MGKDNIPVRATTAFEPKQTTIIDFPQTWKRYEFEAEALWASVPGPDSKHSRWSPLMKFNVVSAINAGHITREELLARYPDMSDKEYRDWERDARNGVKGLGQSSIKERAFDL